MRIEIFAILVCFVFFGAFAAIFLIVKCVQKKARKSSGRIEEDEENETEDDEDGKEDDGNVTSPRCSLLKKWEEGNRHR